MKAMIVDDSEEVRRMIKTFIADLIDDFVDCGDGRDALSLYTMHRPDLVLMDIEMKEMDGLTATQQIRAAYPMANVIIVSQWDTPALRTSAALAGAGGYINKENLAPLRALLASGRVGNSSSVSKEQ
jgi:CheY-like chemotaxis protein